MPQRHRDRGAESLGIRHRDTEAAEPNYLEYATGHRGRRVSRLLCVGRSMRSSPHPKVQAHGRSLGDPRSLRRPLPLSRGEVDALTTRVKKDPRGADARRRAPAGVSPGCERPPDTSHQRTGTSGQTVLTDDGPLMLDIPRDRDGTFEPQLIGKHERRLTGFDDKILAMYARGLTRNPSVSRRVYTVEAARTC